MASCWRELVALRSLEVRVVLVDKFAGDKSAPEFGRKIMEGIETRWLTSKEAFDNRTALKLVEEFLPDVAVVSGWSIPGYRQILRSRAHRNLPVVLCSDNPFRGDWRQRFGYWKVAGFLHRARRIAVPGKRGVDLMRYWRVPDEKIFSGLYGVDSVSLASSSIERGIQANWPRKFLFIGRLDERKGVDRMLAGYREYRMRVQNPWDLVVCGQGPLEGTVRTTAGVDFRGFVSPESLPQVMAESGALLLFSRVDAWPLVIVEACAAGLPVVASRACGSTEELVVEGDNGLLLDDCTPGAIASALVKVDQKGNELEAWGARSLARSKNWSSTEWADRWQKMLVELAAVKC